MRARSFAWVVLTGSLAVAMPVLAHHSTAAEFDQTKPLTLKGAITKMEWRNPHAWLYIDVNQSDGSVVAWALELASPNTLMRQGWRKDALPVGAEVTVEGFNAKEGVFPRPTAVTRYVTLADGKQLFAGPANEAGR